MVLTIYFIFIPYLRHLNLLAAATRALLLQFPAQLFARAPQELKDAISF